jgi:hypothetical protein
MSAGILVWCCLAAALTGINVTRLFRAVIRRAGLGQDWASREMRHSFVPVLTANGVPAESIALLAGARRGHTATADSTYRHEIKSALGPRRQAFRL